ncbi:cell surface protein [Methanosarcina sp. WWM596]|nr:cell surface protein [Methanosarcina sp. WWM596]AKB22715.1 cell surface protein [Methanosarcina sp. WH1]
MSHEPANNIEVSEFSKVFIKNGDAVRFEFAKGATCVVYVGFDSVENVGKTTTTVEQLKVKSTLVSDLPDGEVYKSFNVWVGTAGYSTSKKIKNPVLSFRVEKAWVQEEHIDPASIVLNRYKEQTWEQLPTNLTGQNDKYLYFISEVPGYASFAITGNDSQQISEESTQISAESRSMGKLENPKETESKKDRNTVLSVVIVVVALAVAGIILKSMKK